MKNDTPEPSSVTHKLRKMTEDQLQSIERAETDSMSMEETKNLIHELRAHQIQLETQNEELQRLHAELETSHARYFELYHRAPVVYLTLDEKGTILEANLKAATLLGIPRTSLSGRALNELVIPADQDVFYHHQRRLFETGKLLTCELRLVKYDGTPVWVHMEGVFDKTEEGSALCRVVLTDVSARKQVERDLRASESCFHDLFEHMRAGCVIYDAVDNGRDFQIRYINETAEGYVRQSRDEVIGRLVSEAFPGVVEMGLLDEIRRVWRAGTPGSLPEARYQDERIDEWIESHVFKLPSGQVAATFFLITERRRAEQQLRRTQFIVDHFTDAVFWANEAGALVYVNQAAQASLGYSEEELLGMMLWDVDPKVTPANWPDTIEALQQSRDFTSNSLHARKDGSTFPVEIKGLLIEFEGQRLICGLVHDLTEEELAEQALRESNERYDIAISAAKLGVWERDIASGRLKWNDRMREIYGVANDASDRDLEWWLDQVHPDDRARAQMELSETATNEVPLRREFRIIRPDGSIRHIHAFSASLNDSSGAPDRLVGINQDVTDLHEAREQLAKSRDLLNHAQTVAHIGCWEYDIREDEHLWSDEMYRVFGLEVGAPLPGWEGLRAAFPEDWERLDAAVQGATRGTAYNEEFRLLRPDGSTRWGRTQGSAVKDEKGDITRLIGTVQDITDQVESRERFRLLFNSTPLGIAFYQPEKENTEFTFVDINAVGLRLVGKTHENLIGRAVTEAFPGVKESGVFGALQRVAKTGEPEHLPRTLYKDERVELWVANHIFKLPSGLVVAVYEDITEMHRVEEALRESEERFRSTIQDLQMGVVLHEPDTSIVLCNPAAARMLGVEAEQAIGKGCADPEWNFIREDRSELPVEEFPVNQALAAGEIVSNMIFGIPRADGEEPIWCETTAVPVFGDDGRIKHVIVNFMDISELKRNERALTALNNELTEGQQTLQATLDGLSAHIALLDEKGTILLVNRRWRDFAEQNGMPSDANAEGANYLSVCQDLPNEEDEQIAEIRKGITDVLAGEKTSFSMEYPCHSETEQRWFIATINQFPSAGPHRAVVAHEDITQRKLAEEQLISRNQELEWMNRMMTGRELRMIELKHQINALCRELGREEPYKLTASSDGEEP